TKDLAPRSVTRTARPGTTASQTKLRLPRGAGRRPRIVRSVRGFLDRISGQPRDNILLALPYHPLRPSATRNHDEMGITLAFGCRRAGRGIARNCVAR